MITTDMARELLFDSIDLRFEEFGLPKVEQDNLDNLNLDNSSANLPTKGTKNKNCGARQQEQPAEKLQLR